MTRTAACWSPLARADTLVHGQRAEGLSSGTDVILSDAVRFDPEVDAMLTTSSDLSIEPLEATLKGFGDERFALWRVRRLG